MNNVIAFSVDDNYIDYGVKLVSSITEHDIDAVIVCRGINLSSESIDQINNVNDKVRFIMDRKKLKTTRTLFKRYDNPAEIYWTYKGNLHTPNGIENVRKTMYSEQAAYSCHSRFKTIMELLDKFDCLLCLDADTIVKKNFDHLFEKKDHDMYVVPSGEDDDLFHNEGLLLINSTTNSRSYFKDVHDKIFDGNTFHDWDVDTVILSETYDQSDIDIGLLSKTYKDKQHKTDSYMWSGDGPRKHQDTFKR